MKQKRAALYVRVSSGEQHTEAQERALREYVRRRGWAQLKNLIAGLELCRALGIDFVSVTEAVDTSLPAGEMLFQMIGAVAQFERSLIAE